MKKFQLLAVAFALVSSGSVNLQKAFAQDSSNAVFAAPVAEDIAPSAETYNDHNSAYAAAPASIVENSDNAEQTTPEPYHAKTWRTKKSEKQRITESIANAIAKFKIESEAFDEYSQELDIVSDDLNEAYGLLEEYREDLLAGHDIGMTVAEYNECINRYNEKVDLYEIGERVHMEREADLLAKAKELKSLVNNYRLVYDEIQSLEKRVQFLLASATKQ